MPGRHRGETPGRAETFLPARLHPGRARRPRPSPKWLWPRGPRGGTTRGTGRETRSATFRPSTGPRTDPGYPRGRQPLEAAESRACPWPTRRAGAWSPGGRASERRPASALAISEGADLPFWAGFLCIGGAFGGLAGLLALLGLGKVTKVGPPARTIRTVKDDITWAKHPTVAPNPELDDLRASHR